MNVSNPRRILAVSMTGSSDHLSHVIKDLTGTSPINPSSSTTTSSSSSQAESSTLAGTTHHLPISTAYYKAEVPIWLDLVSDPAEWADTFLSPEAREVLDVLGGIVVVFPLPPTSTSSSGARDGREAETNDFLREVGRVVKEGLGGWEWDGVGLAVGVGDVDVDLKGRGGGGAGEDEVLDGLEDICAEVGLEFVHISCVRGQDGSEKKNEFGERTGIARVLEALEANDWALAEGFGGEDGEEDEEDGGSELAGERRGASREGEDGDHDPSDLDPESLEFGFDREDFAGLRKAIWSGDRGDDGEEEKTEDDVQKLEDMMRKLLAVRDMSAGLPEEQRRRMAKKAVGEVMKEL